MALPVPYYTADVTSEQKAQIAGFLLHERRRILAGLAVARDPAARQVPQWATSMEVHWSEWERCTRFLLYKLGYHVDKDQQYPGWTDGYDPFDHVIRSIVESGWTDPGEPE